VRFILGVRFRWRFMSVQNFKNCKIALKCIMLYQQLFGQFSSDLANFGKIEFVLERPFN